MVSHRSLNDCKSPQVSRTLLSILADSNNAVIWIVSTRPLISKYSSPCTSPLVTVPSTQITIGITIIFMLRSFFRFLARSRYYHHHYYCYYFIFCKSFLPVSTGVFSVKSEWQQVSLCLWDSQHIQANFNKAVVWMVSVLSLISSSSNLFSGNSRIVPKTPTTFGINIAFMFHSLFSPLARSKCFCVSFCFLSFALYDPLEWQNLLVDKFFCSC